MLGASRVGNVITHITSGDKLNMNLMGEVRESPHKLSIGLLVRRLLP